MNKNKELAKNTIVITLGKICTQFASFLLLPFYTALLSTEQYGTVDLVMTYTQLLLPFVTFQIEQAVFRYLLDKRADDESTSVLITSVCFWICLQFLGFTILFTIALFWLKNEYVWFLYCSVLASALSSILLQVTRGLGDNTTYAIGSFLAGFLNVLLNVIFIAVLNMRAEGMVLASILSNLICASYIFLKKKIYKFIGVMYVKKTCIRQLLRYSLPLVPNALAWWVVNASDRSIVLMFLGTSANGILAASHKFPTLFTSLYSMFNMAWTESAALHLKEDDCNEFFSNTFDMVYRIFISCCVGIVACMPFLFNVIINVNYSEAYFQIPIYMIAAMFNIISGLYSVIFIANKQTIEIAKTSLVAGFINVIIHLGLIKEMGLYAASISSAISYAAMAIYRSFDARKYIKHTINYKVLVSSCMLLIGVMLVYYKGNVVEQGIALIITVLYALMINNKLIIVVLHMINKRVTIVKR